MTCPKSLLAWSAPRYEDQAAVTNSFSNHIISQMQSADLHPNLHWNWILCASGLSEALLDVCMLLVEGIAAVCIRRGVYGTHA